MRIGIRVYGRGLYGEDNYKKCARMVIMPFETNDKLNGMETQKMY